MKIAIFLPSLHGGGAERNMINLSRGLIHLGQHLDLVVVNAKGDFASEVHKDVNVFDLKKTRAIRSFKALFNYLETHRPDVLLSTMNYTNLIAIGAVHAANVKTKIIIREANTLTNEKAAAKSIVQQTIPSLVALMYPTADHVIAPSIGVGEDLVKNFSIPRHMLSVIGNPVVDDRLFKMKDEVPKHNFFSDGIPVILGVGRLDYQKDFPTLIRAFAELRKTKKARLVILGRGPLLEDYKKLITELKVDDIHFPGFVKNPYAYMSRASTFVLSSGWEGLPNVPIQALACGCQVVSTDCPSGPREILSDGKFGALVPVGDIAAMANAMRHSLEHKISPKILVERARDFSIERISKKYLELFEVL